MNQEIEKFLKELDEKLKVENIDGVELENKKFKVRVKMKKENLYAVRFETNITGNWGGFCNWVDDREKIRELIQEDLMHRSKFLERE